MDGRVIRAADRHSLAATAPKIFNLSLLIAELRRNEADPLTWQAIEFPPAAFT